MSLQRTAKTSGVGWGGRLRSWMGRSRSRRRSRRLDLDRDEEQDEEPCGTARLISKGGASMKQPPTVLGYRFLAKGPGDYTCVGQVGGVGGARKGVARKGCARSQETGQRWPIAASCFLQKEDENESCLSCSGSRAGSRASWSEAMSHTRVHASIARRLG